MTLAILPPREPDKTAVQLFMDQLGVTNDIASKLAMELTSIEEVAYAPMQELLETHVDEALLKKLRVKAVLIIENGPQQKPSQ